MNLISLLSKVLKKSRLSAIDNSQIHTTSKVESGSTIYNLKMEKHSFCGYNCEIINCEIGSFTSIANNVVVGGGMHPMEWVSMSPVFYEGRDSVKAKFYEHSRKPTKRTIIGHDVWIGHSALIKQGVNIGTGAVVGMGSIVTKDVAPYSIVVGNPAKEIRKRFDNLTIEGLLSSKWWDYNEEELKKMAYLFNDTTKFLKKIKL